MEQITKKVGINTEKKELPLPKFVYKEEEQFGAWQFFIFFNPGMTLRPRTDICVCDLRL